MAQVAVLFEVTKSSLNLSLGAMIAIAYGSQEPITFRKTLGEVIKLPPLWALVLAVAWKAIHLPCPTFFMDATGMLSAGVSGMMILSLGMALKFRMTRLMALVLPVVAIKLVASPYIVSHMVGPLGIVGLFGSATVLEAAMPSQLLSFVIAGRFKLDEETLAFVIMADTLLAIVTLPLVHMWLAAG
jgi:predicted permease